MEYINRITSVKNKAYFISLNKEFTETYLWPDPGDIADTLIYLEDNYKDGTKFGI